MRNTHKTLPLATAALGRTLMACSMMGDELKDERGSVTVQIRGGGPLGAICAVSDAGGNVRGYLQNPAALLPLREDDGKLDVGRGVGTDGVLTVMRDIGEGEPFSGKVELMSGEIADDIAAYYAVSEQVPTVCALGVLVDRDQSVRQAGGYIVQLMPGAPGELTDLLEQRAFECGNVTKQLERGQDIEQVMLHMLRDMDAHVLERHAIQYECKCSREKVEQALISMGRQELERVGSEDEDVTVTCQFCDRVYRFSRDDVRGLLR